MDRAPDGQPATQAPQANGYLLGFSQDYINEHMQEIIEFSELGASRTTSTSFSSFFFTI